MMEEGTSTHPVETYVVENFNFLQTNGFKSLHEVITMISSHLVAVDETLHFRSSLIRMFLDLEDQECSIFI